MLGKLKILILLGLILLTPTYALSQITAIEIRGEDMEGSSKEEILDHIANQIMASKTESEDSLVLKEGKTIKGKIIDETKEKVIINVSGVDITYYRDEILTVKKIIASAQDVKIKPNGMQHDHKNCKHVPLTPERIKASHESSMKLREVDFKDIIKHLKAKEIKKAEELISIRIEALDNLRRNNWQTFDHQPTLSDCLLLRCYMNIYFDRLKEAKADLEFMVNELKMEKTRTMYPMVENFHKKKVEEPEEFAEFISNMTKLAYASINKEYGKEYFKNDGFKITTYESPDKTFSVNQFQNFEVVETKPLVDERNNLFADSLTVTSFSDSFRATVVETIYPKDYFELYSATIESLSKNSVEYSAKQNSQEIISVKDTKFNNYQAREYKLKKGDDEFTLVVFLAGARFYMLETMYREDVAPKIKEFFDSFKIINTNNLGALPGEIIEYTSPNKTFKANHFDTFKEDQYTISLNDPRLKEDPSVNIFVVKSAFKNMLFKTEKIKFSDEEILKKYYSLKTLCLSFVENVLEKNMKVAKKEFITFKGMRTIEYEIENSAETHLEEDKIYHREKAFSTKDAFYILQVMSTKDGIKSDKADAFFNSFELLKD